MVGEIHEAWERVVSTIQVGDHYNWTTSRAELKWADTMLDGENRRGTGNRKRRSHPRTL